MITTDMRLRDDLKANIVLGIGAHADDIDFTAGGTIARLADEGAEVYYLVLTDGSKGTADRSISREELAAKRQAEQREAARSLGVREVYFLSYEDGCLEASSEVKRDITRFIRRLRPEVVMCFDPTMVYAASVNLINHADHRACGQATLDAIYPLARDHLSFPELLSEGLEPHKVQTVLMTNFEKSEYCIDVSNEIERKMTAFALHASQAPDLEQKQDRFRQRMAEVGQKYGCQYAEAFVRLDVSLID